MIVAAVPVKDLATAKQRLAPVLAPEERRELAAAMLRDVLRAVTACGLDGVWVVTRDPAVAIIARQFRATPLLEEENRGHTPAVALAQEAAAARHEQLFLTIPGDVPCVDGDEISRMVLAAAELRAERTPAGVFVPSRSGHGTNGVALAPPRAMRLTFGEPSFANHLAIARDRGVWAHVMKLPGLGLDIDTPEDLLALRAEGAETESGRLVAAWVERQLRRPNSILGEASEGAVAPDGRARNVAPGTD